MTTADQIAFLERWKAGERERIAKMIESEIIVIEADMKAHRMSGDIGGNVIAYLRSVAGKIRGQ